MNSQRIATINSVSFLICLASIAMGVAIGGLAIWGALPVSELLWRALGTCGVLFVASILSSMAIRCFRTNEPPVGDAR